MHCSPNPPTDRIQHRYDVVVVGARVAGSATAMLLARHGLHVLVLDRARPGTDTLSTHSLGRAGVLQLSRWDLLDRIRAAGTPVARTVEFHYGGDPVRVDVSSTDDVDGLYSPRRTVLDTVLAEEARHAGADVHHGVGVQGVTVDDVGRVDGVEIVESGRARRVASAWVVGADGIRSGVAREVGARATRQESAAAAFLYGYWSGLPDDVITNLYDVPGRAVGIIPTNGGKACVWVAMPPATFAVKGRGDVRGLYHRSLSDHGGIQPLLRDASCVGGYRAFPGLPGFLRAAHGPGWALVGDAGYFKDPVSAHGITDAFICAELLADALRDVVADGSDAHATLDRYERDRDDLAALLMPPVARLAGLELDGDGAMAAFKAMGRALRREWELVESLPASSLVGA